MSNESKTSSLSVVTFVLGPVQTNAYLVGDPATGVAVAIDPAWDGEVIVREAETRDWQIEGIWLTHAHFDHTGGVATVAQSADTGIPVALHPEDMPLWRAQGGATFFGFRSFDPGPEPTIDLAQMFGPVSDFFLTDTLLLNPD